MPVGVKEDDCVTTGFLTEVSTDYRNKLEAAEKETAVQTSKTDIKDRGRVERKRFALNTVSLYGIPLDLAITMPLTIEWRHMRQITLMTCISVTQGFCRKCVTTNSLDGPMDSWSV